MRRTWDALTSAWTWLLAELDGERGRFALWLPVLLAAGVLTYFSLRIEPPPWLGAAVAAPAFVLAWLCRRWVWPWFSITPVGCFSLGFAVAQLATWHAPPVETALLPTTATWLSGRVSRSKSCRMAAASPWTASIWTKRTRVWRAPSACGCVRMTP